MSTDNTSSILRKRYPRGCKFKELLMTATSNNLFSVDLFTHENERVNLRYEVGLKEATGTFDDVSLLSPQEAEEAFSSYTH